MSADGRLYEGHTFVHGQDVDTEPSSLPSHVSAKAVNRVFRGGRNKTRPPFLHTPADFVDMTEQQINVFQKGNFQGWHPYLKRKPGREDGIVVSIAGTIFFVTLVNERLSVRVVFLGNDSRLLHTWFVQAEEWLYIQNGKDKPVRWNGLFPSTARRAIDGENEMPVGTLMAYAHGRVFVSNALDQVAASDIIYGDSFTRSDQTFKFTENTYWNEGGYFGMPTDLGHITGMIVMPSLGRNLRGQGELLILSENGASAIDASISRSKWKDSQIQAVTMAGRGPVAPGSVIAVNNDCWFRAADGLSSYRMQQSEFQNRPSLSKLSRQVNRWMDWDTDWLMRFTSSIYFDNRVLTTVAPQLKNPSEEEFGSHRYHKGIVALDLDRASDVSGDSDFNWDGLWTGIRPCALIKLGHRAFAFSHDSDGNNRIYEIATRGVNDRFEGRNVQTEWFYLTKKYDWSASGRSNSFEVKKLVGGQLWVSDVRDLIQVGVDFRPDNLPCWSRSMSTQTFGSRFDNEVKFSLPRYKRFKFTNPEDKCISGAPYPVHHGAQHQFMVKGKGHVQIDRLRLAMAATNDPDSPVGDCDENDPKISIDCQIENDYGYDIASR